MTYALITGASSGIGIEFAKCFAEKNIPMVITSSPRSIEALEKVADDLRKKYSVDVKTVSSDLANTNGAQTLIQWIEKQNIDIEYLINNAGFGIVGKKIYDYEPDKMRQMLQVNINALSELVIYFVPKMIARNKGRILNVSSIAGYVIPHGLEAGYSATKAFVVSFSEGITDDLRGTRVTCTHLAPGPVKTKFFNTAGMQNESKIDKLYMSADTVARQGFNAMMKGKPMVMPGFSNKLMRFLVWLSPSRRLTGKISGFIVTEP